MNLIRLVILTLVISSNAFAQDIEIIGNIKQIIAPPHARLARSPAAVKEITLMKVKLSDKARQVVINRADKTAKQNQALFLNTNQPGRVQLGMNNVPVLDQGNHGTCVTFANTAAIDAALNKGDYISQLCQLTLGRHLEMTAYSPSGWDGSMGRTVLHQMEAFGLVSNDNQRSYGCGGLTAYPLAGPAPDTEISLADYHAISEPMPNSIRWTSILDANQSMLERTDTINTLNSIKTALRAHDRLTFGILLLDFDLGTAGAVGMHHTANDTWVLTPEIARDIYLKPDFAGHEMVITGFDDNAIAVDDKGREHRGLLTLRNSWGNDVADHGDFYMSYDYFKVLAIEVQRIIHLD